MKKVVVTQRLDILPERNEARDALDQRLISFLIQADLLPFPLPGFMSLNEATECQKHFLMQRWFDATQPCGIILSGGNDIGQCRGRDSAELWLLDLASFLRLPVLGICRGMQMMAHWAGTKLHPSTGHIRTHHLVSGHISSYVNSYHNYSICECPEAFQILAQSEDGEIEAIAHKYLPWEGWMWHPEREKAFSRQDIQRLKQLFSIYTPQYSL